MLDPGFKHKAVNQWSIMSRGKDYLAQAKAGRSKKGEAKRRRVQQRDSDSCTRLRLRGKWEKSLFLLLK